MTQSTHSLELIPPSYKTCTTCGEEKPLSEYHKNAQATDGKKNVCKSCIKVSSAKYYKTHRNYEYKYGISLDDVKRMEVEQDFSCATCGKKEKLFVDHCHDTGSVRGLLCRHCNTTLGMAFDNVDTLKAMIKYLERE